MENEIALVPGGGIKLVGSRPLIGTDAGRKTSVGELGNWKI